MTRDAALGRILRGAIIAAGAEVRVAATGAELGVGPLPADLLVIHVAVDGADGAGLDLAELGRLAAQLPVGGKVLALLPRGDLATTVEVMRAHPRVASVISVERMRASDLTAVAARLLDGDVFGLEKVLPWGARVHTLLVGDYAEKAAAVQEIAAFAHAVGVRRYHRDRIERCADEMMMNAIYDAPVAAGRVAPLPRAQARLVRDLQPASRTWSPMGDDEPTRPRGSAPADRAVVEFGCDGQRFAIAVRDRHGRFQRDVLVRCLHRCLREARPIENRGGGAGLGLYLLSRSSSALMFNLLPGTATECICLFDLEAPRSQIDQIGVYQERVDEHGRLAHRSARVGHPVERRRARPDGGGPVGFPPVPHPSPARIDGLRPLAAAMTLLLLGLFALCFAVPRLYATPAARGAAPSTTRPALERAADLRPYQSRRCLPLGTP